MAAASHARKHHKYLRVRKRDALLVAVTVFAAYVIAPQLGQFAHAYAAVRNADVLFIGLAGIMICVAVASSAAVYVFLAIRPVRYRESLIVQTAGMFVNRLLPAGAGGMGLSADFLYRRGHTIARSATIVACNNLLTAAGHIGLLLLSIVTGLLPTPNIGSVHINGAYLIAGLAGAAIAVYAARIRLLPAIAAALHEVAGTFRLYGKRKARVILALGFALGNTLGHASAIALCMHAFGLEVPAVTALAVLAGGVAVASVTPTPGGLLGSETGLTAVLIGFGAEPGSALGVALSYRLVSYWLPIFPGIAAFYYATKKRII